MINHDVLRKIGLTEGEIRVYEALIHLGKSSTGNIMQKSKISSSKVYLILDKLVEKGLVTFIVENNVKQFSVANPIAIKEYLDKQKDEITALSKESEAVISQIALIVGTQDVESAQVYKGFAGIKTAILNLVEEMDEGDEFLFFAQERVDLENPVVLSMYENFAQRRNEKNISSRGIVSESVKDIFEKVAKRSKNYTFRTTTLFLSLVLHIGKNRVLVQVWGDNPLCFEITSKRIRDRFAQFFESMWEIAK